MAISPSFSSFITTFVLLCSIVLSAIPIAAAGKVGFTLDLIHRDSRRSPFYNPSSTLLDRLDNAVQRSFSRVNNYKLLSNSSATIQSQLRSSSGEYLMKVAIGTPPVDVLAIADTGSDLTWTQCKPCEECYKQNAELFDPSKTSTYKSLSCESQFCSDVGTSSCSNSNTCNYRVTYGDQSYSIGDLAVDTFTFGSSSGEAISLPKVVFGCGHENAGNFNETGTGIVGLGGGSLSIIKQLDKSIDGKFSYCLVPIDSDSNVTSKLNFGSNAVVSGPKVVSTPIVKKSPDTFYYLTLEGISVGKKRLEYKSKSRLDAVDEGNIIIDSGTTLTMLPREFYQDLESALVKAIKGERTTDSRGIFGLCYKTTGQLNTPKIVVHFTGADLELQPSSTFLLVEDGTACLTLIPAEDTAIFGNLSQMNLLVGYDLVNNKVSFKPTDCTKN